jgi:predicted DNA-binding transcriptional regulator AlpA
MKNYKTTGRRRQQLIAQANAARESNPRQSQVSPPDTSRSGRRLIDKHEVIRRVGYSYQSIWRWMCEGKFPRSVKGRGKSLWYEDEIDAWQANLPRSRLRGDPPTGGDQQQHQRQRRRRQRRGSADESARI